MSETVSKIQDRNTGKIAYLEDEQARASISDMNLFCLKVSQTQPNGARIWCQPTFPAYSNEFYYIDEWLQNSKFVTNSDKTEWISTKNEGTSCNENKMYVGNVNKLLIKNNTSNTISFALHYKKKDGSLTTSSNSVDSGKTSTMYCILDGNNLYETVKIYVNSLIKPGDIDITVEYA